MHYIQEKLLKLIDHQSISGLTLREVGSLVNETLPQKIKHHLSQLERKGFIIIDKKNSIIKRISGDAKNSDVFISVPIYGTANCGPRTIYASQNLEGYLKVSKKLLTKRDKIFALRAEGNSLNRANINGKNIEDGDFVIVDSQAINPKNGDYIVSIIEEMANIKKYIWDAKNSQIILGSESTQNYNPIYVHEDDNIIINGKVIDVIKKPSM
ncbi:MAG: Transcriptional repressor (LexA family) [Candidatus Magasanikbacteria bacterium GW2011_GWE2_42_7]|uniref:Transcriptional repressor (LexA family) n=1 Tax=Candidatus Magasanikbacteria bacterium GW2011_GWE2_42_7 TaxID=1619052 RepID=A0A0G1BB64_9BACT|nr:MAG: Transcriptional repressor (LexA family) [Candidatus Magasanikbacteria bacterium GW2011_GWE2_42_7]